MTHEDMLYAFLTMPVKKERKSSQLSQVNVTVPLKRMTAKVNTDATLSKCRSGNIVLAALSSPKERTM